MFGEQYSVRIISILDEFCVQGGVRPTEVQAQGWGSAKSSLVSRGLRIFMYTMCMLLIPKENMTTLLLNRSAM